MKVAALAAQGRVKIGLQNRDVEDLLRRDLVLDLNGGHVTFVDVQNVNDHYEWDTTERIINDFKESDGLTPPWPLCWLEFAPQADDEKARAWREERGFPHDDQYTTNIGMFVTSYDGATWQTGSNSVHGVWAEKVKWVTTPHRVQIVSIFSYHEPDSYVVGPIGVVFYATDEEGRAIQPRGSDVADTFDVPLWAFALESSMAGGDPNVLLFLLNTGLLVGCAFSFANCKNVEAIPQRSALTRQQRRALERKGVNLPNHYALRVSAIGGGQQAERDAGRLTGDTNRYHIVRGHFVHYGEKYGRKKLFGKWEGRFWKASHAAGDRVKGEIDKTYRVEVPA